MKSEISCLNVIESLPQARKLQACMRERASRMGSRGGGKALHGGYKWACIRRARKMERA